MGSRIRRATVLAAVLLRVTGAGAEAVTVPGSFATIQAAIDGAPDGSVIQVAPGHYAEMLHLDSVSRTLTIRGNPDDPSGVVVDGSRTPGSVVTVRSCGSNVVVEGITVTGGTGGSGIGGGLFMADSQVLFRKCVFTGNSSDPDGGGAFILRSGGLFQDCTFQGNAAVRFGGGVMMNVGATTIFERTRFVDNESGTGNSTEGWGGGLHVNDSSPLLVGCTIQGNRAKFAGGGISVTGHFTVDRSMVTLRDTTIAGNTVVRGGSGYPAAEGGGMHIEDNVLAILDRCHVAGNVSNTGGGLNSYRAAYEITGSVVEANQANLVEGLGGFGGGVYAVSVNVVEPIRPPASVMIQRSAIRDNTGNIGAGIFVQGDFMGLSDNQATLDVRESIVAGNVASGRGGGLFVERTVAGIRGSLILSNRVTATSNSWGGGIASVGGSLTTIEDSTLAGNEALELGGGIYADQGGRLDVTSSQLYGNRAATGGGLGGSGIAVAQAVGPTPGPVSGTVSGSVLSDESGGAEIWESNCDAAQYSTILYTGNVIHNPTDGIYYRNCTGTSATVAAFNGVTGKASGNVDQVARFNRFVAAPTTIRAGAASVLGWCAPGSTGLSLAPPGGPVPGLVGTTDVSPPSSTTYTLSRTGVADATATVHVTCAGLGIPIPRSPRNGNDTVGAGAVTLAWYPADGATSYDVYLDTADDPTTLVAQGTTDTSVSVASLVPGSVYRWKVVAKAAACTEPNAGPVFRFTTCGAEVCYHAGFDDAVLTGWSVSGKGRVEVADGVLYARGKPRLVAMTPAPPIRRGTVTLSLGFRTPRRLLTLLIAHTDAANGIELLVKGNQLRLDHRAAGRPRRLKAARAKLPQGSFTLEVVLTDTAVAVSIGGGTVLSAPRPAATAGAFGFRLVKSGVAVDDIYVAGTP